MDEGALAVGLWDGLPCCPADLLPPLLVVCITTACHHPALGGKVTEAPWALTCPLVASSTARMKETETRRLNPHTCREDAQPEM